MPGAEIFNQFPELRTERLLLRQMEPDDAQALYDYSHDEAVTRYLDWNGPSSAGEAQEMIASWNRMYSERKLLPWGITPSGGGDLIGTIMYMPIRGSFDSKPLLPVTVGFDLSRHYWKQGVMTEALRTVLSFGREAFGAHRIQAEVVPDNKASLKLLERLGFRREGVLHQYLLHESTKMFIDIVMLALLNN